LLSLICPWHCSHRGTETVAACLSCHLKHLFYLWWSVPCACGSPAPKMRKSADSSQPEMASLESCCSATSAHGTARTEAQTLGLLACLATSNFKRIFLGSVHGASISPALEIRRSADSSQAQTASLENSCSASSAHGTALTEPERLGLLACLAPSIFRRSSGGPCPAPPEGLVRQCERLQIARRQKHLDWKAVAQPHLTMALLSPRHRDWGCLLVLPPQTSNLVLRSVHGASNSPALKMRTSADSSQTERARLESCCSASSAHATALTEAQRLGLLACLAPSNFKRSLGGPWRMPLKAML